MRKRPKRATHRRPTGAQPVFSDDPAQDDPHDEIDQELLGIWLSISRLRQLIRDRTLPRIAIRKTAPPGKQPRRKAA